MRNRETEVLAPAGSYECLEAAVQEAVRVLTALIRENQSHLDEYKGILVERYWELLDENN